MVPAERVDDVVRVPHVMLLTIERANAAPSAAGGANADPAATMDSISGVRDGGLCVRACFKRTPRKFGVRDTGQGCGLNCAWPMKR